MVHKKKKRVLKSCIEKIWLEIKSIFIALVVVKTFSRYIDIPMVATNMYTAYRHILETKIKIIKHYEKRENTFQSKVKKNGNDFDKV